MHSLIRTFIIFTVIFLGLINPSKSKPTIIVASRPIELIVKQIAGIRANVVNIVPDSVLPWLYEPSTVDLLRAKAADAVIISSPEIEKWAAGLQDIKLTICMDLLPDEFKIKTKTSSDSISLANDSLSKPEYNPFFWTDPLAVKQIVSAIADTLTAADPDNAGGYKADAEFFSKRLDLLDRQASQKLAGAAGQPLAIYDRSFEYFTKRYNLITAVFFATNIFGRNKIKNLDSVLKIVKGIEANFVFYTNYTPEYIIPLISRRTKTNKIILNPLAIEIMKKETRKKGTKRRNYSDFILDFVRKFQFGLE